MPLTLLIKDRRLIKASAVSLAIIASLAIFAFTISRSLGPLPSSLSQVLGQSASSSSTPTP